MPTTAIIWLEPLTLDKAEATLASREHQLLLAQREGDQYAIDQAIYRRDYAAVQRAKIRHNRR